MRGYCKMCRHISKIKLKYGIRTYSTTVEKDLKIRNIGILAHIDAGKTTTTERMLYYAGRIHFMGEVHDGNTVTDYMEQERTRGITITSASASLHWLNHRINIIDTPGHIDFTMQVEQSLNAIDGAVVILDGSAGVEAQTITVWRQADHYRIPRIVYVNKMDRADASLSLCLNSLESKFNIQVLPLQLPVKGNAKGINGIIDLLSCEHITFSGEEGEYVKKTAITSDNCAIWDEVEKHRSQLIDKLACCDDKLTETVLSTENIHSIPKEELYEALQRVTISEKAIPVLCGSSYKNIGVQLLMNYIVKCLPSPSMRDDLKIFDCFGSALSAKAFKVIHDKQRGAITFFRIYTGSIVRNQKLYNMTKGISEQSQRVMEALADEFKEMPKMTGGNIAAVTGLKQTVIGDLVTVSENNSHAAIKKLAKLRQISDDAARILLCPPNNVPQPVFFCSIEAPSRSYQLALDTALEQLQREDPSLTVTYNEETYQTVIGGMGELHIDIIRDRIRTEYNIEAELGPLQIAYKEYIMSEVKMEDFFNISVGPAKYRVTLRMSIFPKLDDNAPLLVLDKHPDNVANTTNISVQSLNAIRLGLQNSLSHGPKVGCPVLNAQFMIHWFLSPRSTPNSIITSAVAQLARKLLQSVDSKIVEPIISLEIVTDEHRMSAVLGDLGRRRSEILSQTMRANNRVVYALVPLAELLGYSKHLRIITSGHSTFTMELHSYKEVNGQDERDAIKNITGFYPS